MPDKFYGTKVELDAPFGYLEGIPAEFKIEITEEELPPYSWGESRGTEKIIKADLHCIRLGDLELFPHDAMKVFGQEQIARIEKLVEETYEAT